MTGRGRGKYNYRNDVRAEAEAFLREKLSQHLGTMPFGIFHNCDENVNLL